MNQKCVTLQPI